MRYAVPSILNVAWPLNSFAMTRSGSVVEHLAGDLEGCRRGHLAVDRPLLAVSGHHGLELDLDGRATRLGDAEPHPVPCRERGPQQGICAASRNVVQLDRDLTLIDQARNKFATHVRALH